MDIKACTPLTNLSSLPLEKPDLSDMRSFTMGDLHGNSAKLLYFLDYVGAVSIPDDFYLLWYENTHNKNFAFIKEYINIFADGLRDNIVLAQSDIIIRLLGDELADRSLNDIYTLLILEQLNLKGAKYEILFSNHGAEFLIKYKHLKNQKNGILSDYQSTISHKFTRSLAGLCMMLENNILEFDRLSQIVELHYKTHIKLIGYDLDPANRAIIIYSHAAIDLRVIYLLAVKFNIEHHDENPENLALTIERINHKFADIVRDNLVDEYVNLETISSSFKDEEINLYNVIAFVVWNRDYSLLNRPLIHNGYKVDYCHGHDKVVYNLDDHPNLHCLDNLCGIDDESNLASMPILSSNGVQLANDFAKNNVAGFSFTSNEDKT